MDEPCPVTAMDSFSREFIALCHQQSNAACMYCGRDYEWHVREGVYQRIANRTRGGTQNSNIDAF